MKGKNYYYSCVKPEESDAQTERFRALGARDGEIFIDTIGEKSSQRNNLRLLKQLALREGDTLTVSSLYCLSDLKKGLADELHWMRDNGIRLRIADIPLSVQEHDEKSQQFLSDLMFEVFDATILKEREQRHQKQKRSGKQQLRFGAALFWGRHACLAAGRGLLWPGHKCLLELCLRCNRIMTSCRKCNIPWAFALFCA